jgi:hypothetical protein
MVIKVAERPLPRALAESHEYTALSEPARRGLMEHVRYVQELPFKVVEWLETGASASDLQSLIERLDLDLTIHLGVPKQPEDAVSPWLLQTSWVSHSKPLSSFLKSQRIRDINAHPPEVGQTLHYIEQWLTSIAGAVEHLLSDFFDSTSYDESVAHLVAVNVLLAGIKLGVGRIRLQYPGTPAPALTRA